MTRTATRVVAPRYRLSTTSAWGPSPSPTRAIPMDATRSASQVRLTFDLAGLTSAEVDVTVEKNVLTVSATRSFADVEGESVISRERRGGKLQRQVVLGDELDGTSVAASMDNGVLELRIPVAEQAKPQRVAIEDSAPAIEASSSDTAVDPALTEPALKDPALDSEVTEPETN